MPTRLRFRRLLVSLCSIGLMGCASNEVLLRDVRSRAGPHAVACGFVLPGADPQKADDCALGAFREGRAFWVGYARCRVGSEFEAVWILSADGTVRTLRYETEPTARSSRFGPAHRLVEQECSPLVFQVRPGRFRLGCEDTSREEDASNGTCPSPCLFASVTSSP